MFVYSTHVRWLLILSKISTYQQRVQSIEYTYIYNLYYLDVFIGRADALLDGAERLRVAHLTKLGGHAGREAAEDRRRLLRRRLYHRFRFLVSGDKKKSNYKQQQHINTSTQVGTSLSLNRYKWLLYYSLKLTVRVLCLPRWLC